MFINVETYVLSLLNLLPEKHFMRLCYHIARQVDDKLSASHMCLLRLISLLMKMFLF